MVELRFGKSSSGKSSTTPENPNSSSSSEGGPAAASPMVSPTTAMRKTEKLKKQLRNSMSTENPIKVIKGELADTEDQQGIDELYRDARSFISMPFPVYKNFIQPENG